MNARRVDLTGQRFGRWTVISFYDIRPGGTRWLCRCQCGKERPVANGNLKRGTTKSCGCLQLEAVKKSRTTHGQSRHALYRTYAGIKDRCSNPNTMCFKDYGGRGIKVCDRWLKDFWNFWDDMSPGWRPGLSIDRIDVNGDYKPGNCRWANQSEQMRNVRTNVLIDTPLGRMTIAEAAEKSGLSPTAIKYRVFSKWPSDQLLDPTRRRRWWRREPE
jgi:hypothetical protein